MELFELYLSPIDATQFKVIVTQSPAGEGETESSLPFCDDSQDWRTTLIRTLESASFHSGNFNKGEQKWMVKAEILAADRTTFHPDYQAKIGKALYRALFPCGSKVERALHSSLRQAEEKNTQLLVQLKLAADVVQRSRLSDYPWELLHDGQRFLLHHQLGLSRYIAHDTSPPALPPVEQVNVLLVSSAASDSKLELERLSKKEQQAIRKGLEKATDAGHICLRELEYPTFQELRTYLTENRGKEAPHVLHFDGHGLFGKRCQQCGAMYKGIKVERCKKEACLAPLPEPQGYLVFEDEEGEADYISAEQLGTLLHQTRLNDGTHQTGGVALVVLSACKSGMAIAGESVFNGTAQNLIGHRVPAVVAMQYSVMDTAATKFAEQFYRSLGQKDSLTVAVNQGRAAMGADGNQWYRPVLYLRWRDNEGGQLFAVSPALIPSQISETITLIYAQLQRLAREQGINASINDTVATQILDVPLLVEYLSRREETVKGLVEIFANHTWVAIHGSMGSGKTQLASLLTHELGTCRAWVRLRDLTTEQACQRLDAACGELVASQPPSNRYMWYCQLCKQLGSKAMIVLDDLPRLSRSNELSERLTLLARACRAYGIRLLSTSPYPLPPSLASLGGQILYEIESPPFKDVEAAEVLQAYGAPALFSTKIARFVNLLAKGHPLLLTAIAKYLHQENWRFTEKALEGLFKSEYTVALNDETIERLLATIEDVETRELLYRLTLIRGNFSLEDMQALANINPAIERPRERLNPLVGLWVQRDTNNRLLVSPLVQALGNSDLPLDTQKVCHLVIGNRIIGKQHLNPLDVMSAVSHFCAAEAFERAAIMMMLTLQQMDSEEVWANDGGLLYVWCDLPLPTQISLGIRLVLRGLQVAVHHKYGRTIAYLVEDLDILLQQASENEAWAVLLAAIGANQVLAQEDPMRANQYLLAALRLLPKARLPDGSDLTFPEEACPEGLIWFNMRGITTVDYLRDWISTVEQLTDEQRQYAFSAELAEPGCSTLLENLYLTEKDKPQALQQWQTLVDAIEELSNRVRRLGLDLLWACAIRVQIDILVKHLNKLDVAVAVAETAISYESNDQRVQLLIGECMGRHYVNANCNNEALIWLNQALEQSTASYPAVRLDTLISASRAVGSADPYAAVHYVQQAVSLAETSQAISETIRVRTLGELAIAQWLAGDISAAFKPWNQAGEKLFACKADTDNWKEVFVIYSHVSGYLTPLASGGTPPISTLDGSPYLKPERGIFFTDASGRARVYNDSLDSYLTLHLADFADAVGDDERAAAWTLRGMNMARQANQLTALPVFVMNAIPHLLLNDRYAEVLDLALESGAICIVDRQHRQAGGEPLASNLDVDAILGLKPNELWQQAERDAAVMGLLPIAFRLSTVASNQSELAQTQAVEVAARCRRVGTTAVNQQFWTTAAELLENIYLRETSCLELLQRGNTFAAQDDDVLWTISYLGATFQSDAKLQNALMAHLYITRRMYLSLKPSSVTYRRIVLPFLSTYWTTKFEQMRFRFRSPRLIEKELSETKSVPEERRAQSILRTVASGLDMSTPSEFAQWLWTE